LNIPTPTLNAFMSDTEAASIRKPRQRLSHTEESLLMSITFRKSNPNIKNFNDYLTVLPSARPRSATDTRNRSTSPTICKIVTRNLNVRKLH
jgi:hypothetical protein